MISGFRWTVCVRRVRHLSTALLTACLWVGALPADGQPLVPLSDQVQEPLLPTGISRDSVELSGQYAYVWSEADGSQVIQFVGSFELLTGARRLRAQAAVVWMSRAVWQDKSYYHYEVFLWREARLIEATGTVTSGPALFVTFNSYQPAEVRADATTRDSSADTDLYHEASRIRQTIAQTGVVTTRPEDMRIVPIGTAAQPAPPRVRPAVSFYGKEQQINQKEGFVTLIGDVYVSQGLIESAEFLEIRADAAVLFLTRPESGPRTSEDTEAPAETPGAARRPAPGILEGPGPARLSDQLGREVAGAYLEGNVILTRGEQMIRTPQVYYDFENERALMLDAVMRTPILDRNVPLYVRARQVRQLSSTEFAARRAMISTSEFHTPHVYLGAEKVFVTDRTPRDEAGRITGIAAGQYKAYDTTLNVEGVPILYWPYSQGDFQQTENTLRSAKFGYSDDFGITAQTKWYLFKLLGLQMPDGWDSALRLDYFSERGPGVGVDFDYETENYFGLFRGYYINDHGDDELGPLFSGPPEHDNRGRVTWRHRQYLPKDWELSLEVDYLSDPTFLWEFFPSQWFDEPHDTAVYLKKQRDNWAFTLLGQWRINDFITQTEHLPDAAFHLIGEPLGEFASLFSETHVGAVRFRPADCLNASNSDPDFLNPDVYRFLGVTPCYPWPVAYAPPQGRAADSSRVTFRAVTREEVHVPLKIGDFKLAPFATGRVGYWGDSPAEGGLTQGYGNIGARFGTQFWRLFEEVTSRLFDVNGVRHVIKPEFTGWLAAANKNSSDLFPFDQSIEGINDFSGASLAVRQRWQTKRGGPGRWRVVDWITWDVQMGVFDDAPDNQTPIGHTYLSRPENSIARNNITSDFSYRISDTTAILSDCNWDMTDGNMDLFNISYAVERTPRFSYFVGYRKIHDTDSNLLGIGANYEINTKHTVAVREYFDLERGDTETFDITIIRRFPRWYAALTFGVDNIEDNVNVSVSVWPEGVPEAAIGSKRYTGLATSTGINAQTREQ